MPDGTEGLAETQDVQPTEDTSNAPSEQPEGASDTRDDSEGAWAPPSYLDEKYAEALGKLPADQREAFLSLGEDGLPAVREHVLKSVDYHSKRQKEARELRELKEKLRDFEQKAQYWDAAAQDPGEAARIFQAMAGGELDSRPAAQPEETVSLRDILYDADPDSIEQKVAAYEKAQEARLRKVVEDTLRNSPESKQRALSQTVAKMQQTSGLPEDSFRRVLGTVQEVLDKRGVDHTSLSPEALELLIAPAIEYERSSLGTQRANPNPRTQPGTQATGLRGTGPGSTAPMLKKPSADASIEEKVAWTLKTMGKAPNELF